MEPVYLTRIPIIASPIGSIPSFVYLWNIQNMIWIWSDVKVMFVHYSNMFSHFPMWSIIHKALSLRHSDSQWILLFLSSQHIHIRDHYHIHMIETCACVVLVLMILIYLQCKRWNMRKLYVLSPIISSSAASGEEIVSVMSNHQPLLKSQKQPTYDTTNCDIRATVELRETSESRSTMNGDVEVWINLSVHW